MAQNCGPHCVLAMGSNSGQSLEQRQHILGIDETKADLWCSKILATVQGSESPELVPNTLP